MHERGLEVLRVIVSDYIVTKEPVGSKTLVERHGFGVSAATIRNDMAALEEADLIVAPHTSAGRVPTDKGYRLFVDRLAARHPLDQVQRRAIERFVHDASDPDDLVARAVRSLARLTQSVAIAQYPSFSRVRIHHVELVRLSERRILTVLITDSGRIDQGVGELRAPIDADLLTRLRLHFRRVLIGKRLEDAADALGDLSGVFDADEAVLIAPIVRGVAGQVRSHRDDRLVLAGTANLARTERDFSSILPVLDAIEEQVVILRLLAELDVPENDVRLVIGRENAVASLEETSILASDYTSDGAPARLVVLGPTRMDYERNIAAVQAVARYLSRTLADRDRP